MLERVVIGAVGLEGDRQLAVVDRATGRALTARRAPRLLFLHAWLDEGRLRLVDDAGAELDSDAALSAWLGRDVELRRPDAFDPPEYDGLVDDFDETGGWDSWRGPVGVWHDSSGARVSITTLQTLGSWPVARFRPNVVLASGDERTLVGRRVRIGTVELDVVKAIGRCVMVTRDQPGGIARDPEVLRTVHRERGGNLAVGALVVRTGECAVGDVLEDVGASVATVSDVDG